MKAILFLSLFIVIVSIAISLLLIPSSSELTYMRYKDKEYDAVKMVYEDMIEENTWSAQVVFPLMQTYTALGQPERSIDLLEQYLRKEPNDIEASSLLSSLYERSQMYSDYLTSLETEKKLHLSEALLRKLIKEYEKTADYSGIIKTSKILVEKFKADTTDLIKLGYVQASKGQLVDASNTFLKANELSSRLLKLKDKKMLFSLLIDQGLSEKALQIATAWFKNKSIDQELVHFGQWLNQNKTPQYTIALLTNITNNINKNDKLLRVYISAEILSGARDKAFIHLQECKKEDLLPEDLVPLYIELALEHDKFEIAKSIALDCNPVILADWLRVKIIESALNYKDIEWIHNFLSHLDNSWLSKQPLLSIKIALAEGEKAKALKLVDYMMQKNKLNIVDKLSLVKLFVLTYQFERANHILKQNIKNPNIPVLYYRDLAYLYLQLDEIEAGLNFFTSLQDMQVVNNSANIGWALLAAKMGLYQQVITWLKKKPYVDEQTLKDLFFIAIKGKEAELALLSADRMFKYDSNKVNRKYLVQALMENNRSQEALIHIRKLDIHEENNESLYVKALLDSGKKEELARIWIKKLKNEKLSEKETTEILYNLLSIERYSQIIPYLYEYAEKKSGEWVFYYIDANLKIGRRKTAIESLVKYANSENIADKDRRKIGYKLLELNIKNEAIEIFKTLAAKASPEDSDIDQLLFLWGPRPERGALEWVEQRITITDTLEKHFWLKVLLNIGGERRVIKLVENNHNLKKSSLNSTYIEALLKSKQWFKLNKALQLNLDQIINIDTLIRYSQIAHELNNTEIVEKIWRKILSLSPNNQKSLRELGMIAFSKGEYENAIAYLKQYKSINENDIEVNYILAEALHTLNYNPEANLVFQQTLDQLEMLNNPSYSLRSLKMLMLARVDKIQQSKTLYEHLRKEKPDNLKLFNDYIAILYEKGLYQQAKEMLAAQ